MALTRCAAVVQTFFPGESATVDMAVPTTRLAFSDRTLTRIVEPGEVELWIGTSTHRHTRTRITLTGEAAPVTNASPRWTTTAIG
ncbi:fibronectin type III-like domain-contianing protein [Micromonospora endophytica]|uniref:fibronectin type III-like domain-contianing protein n=1 Tax=Micromonospora endophytica TaxID=515350 RepID=UPI001C339137|nr:hypothetical protein Jiend_01770 [Micromonospora endophytica]